MEDYGLVWVDITPDFDPHLYEESFADEDQADLIRESDSVRIPFVPYTSGVTYQSAMAVSSSFYQKMSLMRWAMGQRL